MATTPPPSKNDYHSSNAPTPILYDPSASSAPTPIVLTSQDIANKANFTRWVQSIDPEVLQNMSATQIPPQYKDLFFELKTTVLFNSYGNKKNNLFNDLLLEPKGGRRSKSKKKKSKKSKKSKKKK